MKFYQMCLAASLMFLPIELNLVQTGVVTGLFVVIHECRVDVLGGFKKLSASGCLVWRILVMAKFVDFIEVDGPKSALLIARKPGILPELNGVFLGPLFALFF
jgi:hypothetical protein